MTEDKSRKQADGSVPTKRELQQPIGETSTGGGTWISGTGDEEHDPQRQEAAKRAARAVEAGRERE
jgi:hypothetical protein